VAVVKSHYFWPGMKKEIVEYITICMECQKVKAKHSHLAGLLQPLPIPEWKWDVVTMDFITGLPRKSKQHDSIMVVVDKLTKAAHFIPLKNTHIATRFFGPFEILERIASVAYMLALPASMTVHNVFHVSLLKKYVPYVNHVIDWNVIQVEPEGVLQVHPVRILDRKRKQLWNRIIELVKVQWTWYRPEDTTWKHADAMWAEYPHLFENF
jgi:hypothetical protein